MASDAFAGQQREQLASLIRQYALRCFPFGHDRSYSDRTARQALAASLCDFHASSYGFDYGALLAEVGL